MKLPSRDKIQELKAAEQRVQIETGLKIAAKVDQVRETLNKEEGELRKFRDVTSKVLQKEIDDLLFVKNNLSYEVKILEKKKELLEKPFEEEWERMRNQKISELDAIKDELVEKKTSILALEKSLHDKELLLIRDEARVKRDLEDSATRLKEAETKYLDAENIWRNAELKQAQVNSELDAERNQLLKLKSDIDAKSLDLSIQEDAIKEAAAALAQKEKFINDKYKTLMRTEKFISNKNK